MSNWSFFFFFFFYLWKTGSNLKRCDLHKMTIWPNIPQEVFNLCWYITHGTQWVNTGTNYTSFSFSLCNGNCYSSLVNFYFIWNDSHCPRKTDREGGKETEKKISVQPTHLSQLQLKRTLNTFDSSDEWTFASDFEATQSHKITRENEFTQQKVRNSKQWTYQTLWFISIFKEKCAHCSCRFWDNWETNTNLVNLVSKERIPLFFLLFQNKCFSSSPNEWLRSRHERNSIQYIMIWNDWHIEFHLIKWSFTYFLNENANKSDLAKKTHIFWANKRKEKRLLNKSNVNIRKLFSLNFLFLFDFVSFYFV